MRLFIAVELSLAARVGAADVSGALQRELSNRAPRARLTWVPTDRMHLTIRFLGDLDETMREAIESTLAAPLDTVAFTLTLGGVGAFPPRGAPRVLWLGIAQGLTDLQCLERDVTRRLQIAGIPEDSHAFNPHLTLARVRDPQGLRLPADLTGVVEPRHGSTHIDAITLFESRLSPRGPTYLPLRRTPLRSA
jgi:RNA 2',3'-cyclic 3'-phosphodiesterase